MSNQRVAGRPSRPPHDRRAKHPGLRRGRWGEYPDIGPGVFSSAPTWRRTTTCTCDSVVTCCRWVFSWSFIGTDPLYVGHLLFIRCPILLLMRMLGGNKSISANGMLSIQVVVALFSFYLCYCGDANFAPSTLLCVLISSSFSWLFVCAT